MVVHTPQRAGARPPQGALRADALQPFQGLPLLRAQPELRITGPGRAPGRELLPPLGRAAAAPCGRVARHHPRYLQVRAVPPLRHRVPKHPAGGAPSPRRTAALTPSSARPWACRSTPRPAPCAASARWCAPRARWRKPTDWSACGRRCPTRKSAWWCRPRPPCARRWARRSAIPWVRASRARWPPPCTSWALTTCSTPTSPPT